MSVAAAIRKMLSDGLTTEQALIAAEAMELHAAPTIKPADETAERRRAWDREYRRRKRESGGQKVESADTKNTRKTPDIHPTPPSLARVEDKTLKLVSSGKKESTEANASYISSSGLFDPSESVVICASPRLALEAYNRAAEPLGLPKANLLSDQRKRKLDLLLKRHGLADWNQALEMLARSPHCLGENDRGWKADLDFILKPDKFLKLLEGGYSQGPRYGQPTRAAIAHAGRLDNMQRAFATPAARHREFD